MNLKTLPKTLTCFLLFLLLVNCNSEVNTPQSSQSDDVNIKLFTSLDKSKTKVDFVNVIEENEQANFYTDQYFYNGGGVAIGDLNNDGLPDICFTGNMVPNSIFINNGNMEFKDISSLANIDPRDGWTTGVSMIDINNDGFLDIYICRGGTLDKTEETRTNLLYINNGDLTFSEKAADYGLADPAYSIQAAFLDYDLDGDVDMYLANRPKSFVLDYEDRKIKAENPSDHERDKLYRNNGDLTFTDVSKEAGIINFGHGLGVAVGDLNSDGLPDIYVANDYQEPDYYYVNNGDGTFTESIKKFFPHLANFAMGSDIADFNNDGFLDIIVVDMTAEDNFRQKTLMAGMNPERFWSFIRLGSHFQYMRNALQLNHGNGYFAEIGQLAGVMYTDWSWSTLLADLDNDGFKDLIVTNGYLNDVRDKDFVKKTNQLAESNGGVLPWDVIKRELTSVETPSYVFRNNGDYTFTKKNEQWGFDVMGFSNGAAYGDLDLDGDLDVVISNINKEASILENHADQIEDRNYFRIMLVGSDKNYNALGTTVKITTQDGFQFQENYLIKQ